MDNLPNNLIQDLSSPTDKRMHALAAAMRSGRYTVDRIHELTNIDRWFLYRMQSIIDLAVKLEEFSVSFRMKMVIG
jgi:carbamoyl-phosphate synthase large subunit